MTQHKDMELGWRLLSVKCNNNNNNSQTIHAIRVLKIEMAQRLEDCFKLEEAFQDLMKSQMSQEDIVVAFTAAPFLGDWKAMLKLGAKIEKIPRGLEELNRMSLQMPMPNFTLVYDLVKEHNLGTKKKQPLENLRWDLFNVEKVRVKFKDVDCGAFTDRRQQLINEIKEKKNVNWEDVPNCTQVHIKRMGALCQAVSFGDCPTILNGPWIEGQIHVKGHTEMPLMAAEEQEMLKHH